MPLWKRLFVISASFGIGIAVAVAVITGAVMWYQSRPQPWNANAVKGSFGTVEFDTQPSKDSYMVEFLYDLQNTTLKNYDISPANLTVMAVLTEGNTLSKEFGHYQTSDATIEGPAFIPPQGKARIVIKVPYQYPSTFAQTDKNDAKKVSASLDHRLVELSGFVIFDQPNHYRIDLPEGWKSWESVKAATEADK